jgi:Fic family protein
MEIIREQINSLSKFIFQQSKLISLNIPLSKIEKEIRNNYSFYWYHYLNTQLQYIKFWQGRLKDLEMLLIGLQTLIQTVKYLKTTGKFQSLDSFALNKMPKGAVSVNIKNANISATSISEVTGIPRANCIRKLEKYIKMKVVEKDPITKRYYLVPNQLSVAQASPSSNILLDGIKYTISIFSEFSSTLLKSLTK